MHQRKCALMITAASLLLVLLCVCLVFFFRTAFSVTDSPECSEDLGIVFSDTESRLEVLAVLDGSRANRSGILPGDWIVSADHEQVFSVEQLDSIIRSRVSMGAASLNVELLRDAQPEEASLSLRDHPDAPIF